MIINYLKLAFRKSEKMVTTPGNAGGTFMNLIPDIEAYTRVQLLVNDDGFCFNWNNCFQNSNTHH